MIERRIKDGTLWKWYEWGALSPFFLLDDLGKFRGEGRRIEEEVYNLVKLRHEARLGMIVTTNCSDNDLVSMFSPAIGIAIVERLREMCKAVQFGRHEGLTQETKTSQVDLHNADL
jgi:DNA replication protein DnaC